MQALGQALGNAIDPADAAVVVALEGELGAGKTTLVGGILRAYGIPGPVRSPTYTLVEPYELAGELAGRQVYHLDLYRLVDPQEVEPLGIRDLLTAGAVLLIEWPSRAAGALPAFDLEIRIDYPADAASGRHVTLHPHSPSGHKVVQRIVAAIPELRLLSP
jgi:tRNA threonylcarbamoyladenosine biosynthesis protein TsaE